MKLNVDSLNNKLKEYKQQSVITYYSAEPKKLIVNDIEYHGNAALRVIRRIGGDKLWVQNFDRIYLSFEPDVEKHIKSAICAKGGKSCQSIHRDKTKKNLNTGVPWNAGMKGVYPHTEFWQEGKTKDTDDRLRLLSESRKGIGNPMYGTTPTEESNKIKSSIMKKKILDGTFTPNSNNRNTHWDSYFNGIKFRSSWEAIYYSLNGSDLYESLRIPYLFDNIPHVYIVDFVNHITKSATEIKPKGLLNRIKEKAKLDALAAWCDSNQYTMNIITEEDIQIMSSLVDITKFDNNTQRKIKGLHEAYKKNRN